MYLHIYNGMYNHIGIEVTPEVSSRNDNGNVYLAFIPHNLANLQDIILELIGKGCESFTIESTVVLVKLVNEVTFETTHQIPPQGSYF